MKHFNIEDLDNMPSRYRAHLINSCTGYKSANLLGSKSNTGNTNLAIFNSVIHIGSLGIVGGAVDDGTPLYVVGLEPEAKRVVVGPQEALLVSDIYIKDLNWLTAPIPKAGLQIGVKVRSTRPPVPATIKGLGNGSAHIRLGEPEAGVAPGQACVVYDGDRVLGGGWIMGAEKTKCAS